MPLSKNNIVIEFSTDASTILAVMLDAFEQTRQGPHPSSALFETTTLIEEELASGKEALVLYEDGVACGMVKLTTKDNSLYFSRLSVRVTARKKGYATMLIDYIEQLVKARHLPCVTCNVRADEHGNIAFYQKLGFTIVGSHVFHHPHGYKIDIYALQKCCKGGGADHDWHND